MALTHNFIEHGYSQLATDIANKALALPDLSTGILNRVRAEAIMKAADIATQWGDARIDECGGIALRNCADHIRTLAADMEAGKC